jgi:3-phosphoshikimate 1-carboxyvinyltransferase
MKPIKQKDSINCTVNIPGSKSISHRALIAAGLAKGKSTLKSFLACDDTLYTAGAIQKLGIDIAIKEDTVHVSGNEGVFNSVSEKLEIDL